MSESQHGADATQPPANRKSDVPTRPRHVDRRSLILGGAGLVIGAGVAEETNAVARTPPPTEPNIPSPGEELMVEHGLLKRVLLAYRAAGDQLAAGQTPPAKAIIEAAQLISTYVESFHEGLEEAYVFPRVRQHHNDLVKTLLAQHDRGRHLTASILLAAGDDLSSAPIRDSLRADMAKFVRMYEPHEAWEDTVIYPALRTLTTQRTLDQLAERFAELENKQYGDHALAQMIDRVSGIEEQLGIADLSAFTP
ncbi:hemerythrin-like domain-containing protein [Antricoccus suffuscus]|uniref:Hemerythrin-like domain-containing protein n=1 Tax=Antricoccus suffuscus TaxID=1629062 RepID=A0A2T1A648_9ACTN|nr:hemerythrin domain-containing protein [Antricoccus suffuscus]PRZ44070.1 hemerythrin-like domain-containing protein [Antricoccus suffuscus]